MMGHDSTANEPTVHSHSIPLASKQRENAHIFSTLSGFRNALVSLRLSETILHLPVQALHISGQTLHLSVQVLHLCGRTLHLSVQALHLSGQTLHLSVQALYLCGRTLHLSVQVLHLCGQTLHLSVQVLHLCGQTLHLSVQVLHLSRRPLHLCAFRINQHSPARLSRRGGGLISWPSWRLWAWHDRRCRRGVPCRRSRGALGLDAPWRTIGGTRAPGA